MLLFRLRGLVRPRDCLPLPMLEVSLLFPARLVSLRSSSLLRSDDDLALASGADNLLLPFTDPVEESEPLLRRSVDASHPSSSSSSLPSYDMPRRRPRPPLIASPPSRWIFTKGDMIAALSAGIVDSPFPPVRVGILDGPGSLDGRFPARMPADETGRELPLPVAPLPMIPAAPVDLRLVDLPPLPAEEVDLADDDLLLPTLPSSLRLELRDCSDGRLLCLDSSDLLLLPLAVAALRPLVPLVAVAGRRGLVPFFFVVATAVSDLLAVLGISSPPPTESSVSTSSAKSTAGAFLLRALCCCTDLAVAAVVILVRAAVVCVPDVLVGDPAAIVPRLDVPLLVGPPVSDLPAPAVVLVVALPGRRLLPGDLDRTGDLDLDRALALAAAVPAPARVVPALAGSGVVLRTGERDLARIAAARALAALVIRTGERDLEGRPLLLVVVLRAAAAEGVSPPSEAVTTPAAAADRVVVRRTGDRDRPRWVLLLALLTPALPPTLVLVIFLPWSLSTSSLLACTPFFFALLALVPTLLAGGRLGES